MRKMYKKRISVLVIGIVLLSVASAIPAMAAGEITATRDISIQEVSPGDTFTVTVTITANQEIEALALDEDLPGGWEVTRVSDDAAAFKASTAEWIWTVKLSAGDSTTVVYDVAVPSNAEGGTTYYITGKVSAYGVSPIEVGGESEVNVNGEKLHYRVAIYGETGGFNLNKHEDEFIVDYSLPCWHGSDFDNNVDKYTNETIDIIFIGGDSTFSSSTASKIENAIYDGKILVINFWSNRKFDSCLPAENAGNAQYGQSLSVVNPDSGISKKIFDGLPLTYPNTGPNYNREHAIAKDNATVLLKFDNDDPALLYWEYGNGYVIEWTLECLGQFFENDDADTIIYRLIKHVSKFKQLPTASFTYSPPNPIVNQSVTFDASSSYDPDGGEITEYWWNVSGTVYTTQKFNRTFTTPGKKYVFLQVKDDEGDTNSTVKWIKVCPENDYAKDSYIKIISGTLAGQDISSSNPEITVPRAKQISGNFDISVKNTGHSGSIFPIVATPNWGPHETSYWGITGHQAPGIKTHTVNVDIIAPSKPGVYYIIVAGMWELSAANVASGTNWCVGENHWDDGNDLADWSTSKIEEAINSGLVIADWEKVEGMVKMYVPATAIRVKVVTETPKAWLHSGYDLCNTRYYPHPSETAVPMNNFNTSWTSLNKGIILTGDINGDKEPELVSGFEERVCALDKEGNQLWSRNVATDSGISGAKVNSMDLADMDGDNIPEVVLGVSPAVPYPGVNKPLRILFYDGNGNLLKTISTPDSHRINVKCADLDGDGTKEVIAVIYAWYTLKPRGVYVYDYSTGNELWHYNVGPQIWIDAIADINNDGYKEIILGSFAPHNGNSDHGTDDSHSYVFCFDKDGNNLWTKQIGWDSVSSSVADLDGDGKVEIISFRNQNEPYYPGPNDVYILNPANGNIMDTYNGPSNKGWKGWSIADINRDGKKEIVVGNRDGKLHVLDHNLNLINSNSISGTVQAINDINGDEKEEIIVCTDNKRIVVLDTDLSKRLDYELGANGNAIVSDLIPDGTNEIIVSADKLYVLSGTPSQPPIVTSITVSPSTATLYVGNTQQFTATAYDQFGNPMAGIVFTWTSNNTTVGTIDVNGLFTAKAAGKTTVMAANGTICGTADVIVTTTCIPPNISWNITISATNQLEPVVAGMRPNATDGYDPDYDVFAQTPVQGKVILILDDVYSTSIKKTRCYNESVSWNLSVGVPTGQTTTLSWDDVPSNVNMTIREGNSILYSGVELSEGSHELLITAKLINRTTFSLKLKPGWNMVSLPLIPDNSSVDAIFGGIPTLDTMPVMIWQSPSFVEVEEIEPKIGYWVFTPTDTTITVTGKPIANTTLNLKAGWNMVGTAGLENLALSDISNQVPQRPAVTWVAPSFVETNVVEPGKSAWVFVTADTVVTAGEGFSTAIKVKALPKITKIESMATTTATEEWNLTLSATNQLEPITFGIHPNATDGYDSENDVFTQTPVQGKVIMILDDIYAKAINRERMIWNLSVGVPAGETTTLTWNPSKIPADVTLTLDGTDMKLRNLMMLGEGSHSFVISGSPIEPTVVFDTGSPTNPYPSIFGTHSGTIMPNQTITVQKLYTYSCAGTGGHTEYVHIYGNGIDKIASWAGYSGDWHNITFDEPFTLFAEKAYNYEIRTGSYPQIIHKPEHTTLDGSFINCTNFIDANGKEYTNWIPAIRLWS